MSCMPLHHPPPPHTHTQCPADIWSLTYPVSFWKDSYCPNEDEAQAGACNSTNTTDRPAACDLDVPLVPPYDQFDLLLSVALGSCLIPRVNRLTSEGNPIQQPSFKSLVCECLNSQDEAFVNLTASSLNAVLSFDFNTTTVVPPADVQPPEQCSNATFVPARNLYVCDAEGQPGACDCPKNIPFFVWGSAVPAECFEFVTAAAEGGKCLAPAAAALSASSSSSPVEARCRISSCPCPEGSPAVPF
jgi:hypothetical protein